MKQEEIIIKKYGKDSGMNVPEGYFSDLQGRIMDSLPPIERRPEVGEISKWKRVRPYIYLAAMFCGIWLMMKLFHTVTQPMSLNLDNSPEALVQLLDRDLDSYEEGYVMLPMALTDDYSLEEEVIMDYDNIADFERDFNNAFSQ